MATKNGKTGNPVPAAPEVKPVVFPDFPIPSDPAGGEIATWKSDLISVATIELSSDNGKNWLCVHAQDGTGLTKKRIPDGQFRAVVFLALATIGGIRSERGWAYKLWVIDNAEKLLQTSLVKYQIRLTYSAKAVVNGAVLTLEQAVQVCRAIDSVMKNSIKAFPPSRKATARKVTKDEDVELIL